MPDIKLPDGRIIKNFPDNPTKEDYDKINKFAGMDVSSSIKPISQQPSPPPQVSKTESALRGGAQGLSLGFADEATARLESIMKGVPYEQALQESRQAYKQAQEANPITYTGSEIAGGVLPSFIPGIGQATTAAKLGKLALIGAGTGAISGLGYSEGDTTGQKIKDVALGAAIGGAFPVAARGVVKGVQSLKPAADEAIKTSLTGFTGKTRTFLDQLDKNPEQVKRIEEKFAGNLNTEILPEISMKIDRFVERNPFAQRAKANSRLSVEKIPENVRVNKQPAIDEIDKVLDVLKKDKVTNTSREAQETLNTYKQRIINELGADDTGEITSDIAGRDLKVFLQNIGGDIERYGGYGNPLKNTKVGQTLKNVRRSLDQELKDKAPEYREIMKTVDRDTVASVKLTRQFMNKEGVDSGKINSFLNRTTQKPTMMDIDRPTKRAIELLETDRPLQTLRQDISDINLKKAIESQSNQGSNLTNPVVAAMTSLGLGLGGNIGGFTGAGFGGTAGGFLGGIAARQLEQRGGKISEAVLRGTKGIRTPTAISESTQRGFATQQGLQRPLAEQFLAENKSEVERRQKMQPKFEQIENRAKSK